MQFSNNHFGLFPLSEGYSSLDSVVVCDSENKFTVEDLLCAICSLKSRLENRPESRVGVYFDSGYGFCIALLAVLHANKTPIILPNVQPGFLTAIEHELDLILTDQLEVSSLPLMVLEDATEKNQSPAQLERLDTGRVQIELFTSGTTGKPKRVVKFLKQLELEVLALNEGFASDVDDLLTSTVSHQHIYGLLFKILWPLCAGRKFWSNTCHYPEQWVEQAKNYKNSHKNIILISSPAHLQRAPLLVDLSLVSGGVSKVFSSGGVLSLDASKAVYKALSVPVTEVFGSTETGGVAYRNQFDAHGKHESWQALPGVRVGVHPDTACLQVASPYTGLDGWFEMSDLAECVGEGCFIIKGRIDRVAKIEEKKVSLIEVEQYLRQCELADNASVVVLSGKRKSLGAVVVLSEEGQKFYCENGKLKLNEAIKGHLGNYFERIVLPRKWRYVDELPLNEQDKILHHEIEKYFLPEYKGKSFPTVLEVKVKEFQLVCEIGIPVDLDYFDGHFSSKPILPGVVQIDWAIKLGKEYLCVDGDFSRMEAIKFHEFICPGDVIKLTLDYDPKEKKIKFSYNAGESKYSSGRVVMTRGGI